MTTQQNPPGSASAQPFAANASSDASTTPKIMPTKRVRKLQTLFVGLLVLSGALNYLDRGALSIANPMIREELGVSFGEMGLLLSAFIWTYALSQLPVGAMVDRMGPRRLLGFGLIFWSLAQAACGFVHNIGQFIWARVFLGVGESPQFPTAARVVANWFAIRDRGFPTGVFNAASPLGTALAPALLTALMLAVGWRWMFIATGMAGLVVAAIWITLYRDPNKVDLTQAEKAYLAHGELRNTTVKVTFAQWRALFGYRTTWGMILGNFGSIYLNWVFLTWLPGYLQVERHMSLMSSGFAASIPFFCGFIGSLVAGWFSDKLAVRGFSAINCRKYPIVAAMIGMAAFTVPAALAESNILAIACISVVVFLANAASANCWALASAVAPPNRVASLGSVQNFGGFCGGAIAPIVTGFIVQITHSFVPALLTGAAIAFVSAMIYLGVVKDPIPE